MARPDNTKAGEESVNAMPKKEIGLNWKWSEGMKPSGRPIKEVLDSARREFLEKEGRLYTEEEAAELVDNIRRELREAKCKSGSSE